MFLTLSTTAQPATDLGFLLHKHPERVLTRDASVGRVHVFYPEATADRCTVALLLEVDPISLVRGRRFGGSDAFSLAQYVNDRPYAASSMLAVALGRAFRTAMRGRCDARPELPQQKWPLEVRLPALPCRGGIAMAERLFGPLGWQVSATPVPLDSTFPEWGDSRYVDVRLRGTMSVADALNHLYLLLPVLDDAKHYWVSTDEVDKLVRSGEGWLQDHPDQDLILRRYLAHQRSLVTTAVGRLAESDDEEPETLDNAVSEEPERVVSLAAQRREVVLEILRSAGVRRVVDLGCGEGSLMKVLLADPTFTQIVGADVSPRALELAAHRLQLDRMPDRQRERVQLIQSSVTYRDDRLHDVDAIVLMEVIEHVDAFRLDALVRAVFGAAKPPIVVLTTPNAEYNIRFENLAAGAMRHRDHRFEWTRTQFQDWAKAVASAHGYLVRYLPIGAEDPKLGPPTQVAVFTRAEVTQAEVTLAAESSTASDLRTTESGNR